MSRTTTFQWLNFALVRHNPTVRTKAKAAVWSKITRIIYIRWMTSEAPEIRVINSSVETEGTNWQVYAQLCFPRKTRLRRCHQREKRSPTCTYLPRVYATNERYAPRLVVIQCNGCNLQGTYCSCTFYARDLAIQFSDSSVCGDESKLLLRSVTRDASALL